MRSTKTRLFVLAVGLIVLLVFLGPILRLARTAYRHRNVIEKLPAGYVDDVSRMNKVQVAETWDIPANPQKAEEQLRDLLQRARASGLHVSIAGGSRSLQQVSELLLRSEEHTSELQSHSDLVCRLLLEKK